MSNYKLTATSKHGIINQIATEQIIAHRNGNEGLADKLYKLSQDAIFDDYLTVKQIKARAIKVLS